MRRIISVPNANTSAVGGLGAGATVRSILPMPSQLAMGGVGRSPNF